MTDHPKDANPEVPVSGANMDRVVARPRYLRAVKLGVVGLIVVLIALGIWMAIPRGLSVKSADLRIAAVTKGDFRDEILFRANTIPFASVMLDATEGGRVEAVPVRDGNLVKQGDLLFRLSNPQREQDVLARASDVAQQVANVAALRAALVAARSDHHRRIADLEYQVDRARKNLARNERLAEQGFLSAAAIEESRDTLQQQVRLLAEARVDAAEENATRQRAIADMDRVLAGLNQGLTLVRATTQALVVRAPTAGRLTDFRLEVGTSVKQGDHLGRIDTPERYKLSALVDEFYLSRVAPGLAGTAEIGGKNVPVVLTRLNSQVRDRRFEIELEFSGEAPEGLQPGQTIDTRITMGKPAPATLLQDGAFFTDTNGAWVFVMAPDGKSAERRAVTFGRRGAGQIEVLSGLAEAERVIVSTYSGFGNALRLRVGE